MGNSVSLLHDTSLFGWIAKIIIAVPTITITVILILSAIMLYKKVKEFSLDKRGEWVRWRTKRYRKKKNKFKEEKEKFEERRNSYENDLKEEYKKKEEEIKRQYLAKENALNSRLNKVFEKKYKKKVRELINDVYDLSLEELGRKYGKKTNENKVSQLWNG